MQLSHISRNKARAELCRRRFYYFLKEFWEVIIQEEFQDNWHIEELCDELQGISTKVIAREPKDYDLVINIPPGTSKSTICTIMFPVWCWVIDPTLKFITGSYSSSLSISHSIKSRDILQSQKFKDYFGGELVLKSDQNNKSNYENNHTGSRMATSVGGASTGHHAHVIIIDDPLNPNQSTSEAERNTANNWVTKTLTTRKINKASTVTILVMQRLHEQDTTSVALANWNQVKHICLPGEVSPSVSPPHLADKYVEGLLDPQRLNRDVLTSLQRGLGSYGYAGQIMQSPTPPEGGIIKRDWLKGRYNLGEFITKQDLVWNFISDTAYTESEANDPSGILCYAFYENNFYIRAAESVYKEFPDLCRRVVDFCYINGYSSQSRIKVEPKASGKSLVQTLKRETQLNIREGDVPDKDKIARTMNILPVLESGRVLFPENEPWVAAVVDQLATFPRAAHDEYVDMVGEMVRTHNSKGGKVSV